METITQQINPKSKDQLIELAKDIRACYELKLEKKRSARFTNPQFNIQAANHFEEKVKQNLAKSPWSSVNQVLKFLKENKL